MADSSSGAPQPGAPAKAAAELLMVGFDGPKVSDELRAFVRDGTPAGVILFARNIESLEQVATLTRELRSLWPMSGPPPLIAIDQEGGRVRRLRGPATPEVSPWPPMGDILPASRDLDHAREVARQIAEVSAVQLGSLGFNLNFAPVLDVDSNPDNPIIGGRAFGADPSVVAELAIAYAAGLQTHGVLACGKHFPGHGDTAQDSHLTLPRLAHRLDRLRRVELAPFEAAVRSGELHCMMTAHIVFEALDALTPATLSPHVIPTLLRGAMGYQGVVVTDDLDMAAIDEHYEAAEIAQQGLAADVDLFLVCHKLDKAAAIREALSATDPARLATSIGRIRELRNRATDHAARPWPGALPGTERGRGLAASLGWPMQETPNRA